jgi:hypothetical protein
MTGLFLSKTEERVGHCVFYALVLASFYFLIGAVDKIIVVGKQSGTINKTEMFKLMLFHLVALILAVGISVHFMGNKLIIALINYTIQIFILGFSAKKNLR